MGAVDKQMLTDLSSEFASVDDERIDRISAIAELRVRKAVWGELYDYALTLYVAHMLSFGTSAGKGAVTSEQIGDIKVTYDAKSSTGIAGSLESTVWGTEYKKLAAGRVGGPLLT